MFRTPTAEGILGGASTDSECPSHSDFDILRSSLFRMGKMGAGPVTGPPWTDHFRSGRTFGRVTTPGSDPLLTSHNSRTHFTKRRGGVFSNQTETCNTRHFTRCHSRQVALALTAWHAQDGDSPLTQHATVGHAVNEAASVKAGL